MNKDMTPEEALNDGINHYKELLKDAELRLNSLIEKVKKNLDVAEFRTAHMLMVDLVYQLSRVDYFKHEIRTYMQLKEELKENKK